MKIQKSFASERGTLYVVGTPIGNLGDLSTRAREILERVDLIAAEDTRHTRKLLTHFHISRPLVSYHKHNQNQQEQLLIERLLSGESVALVSDAGMPTISDPGEQLIERAIEEGVPVVPVPGPVAAISALAASGLPGQPCIFIGFLPRATKKRREELQKWSSIEATFLFYEAPFRVVEMLRAVLDVWGDVKVVISRELTKKHEEFIRGGLRECLSYLEDVPIKGEFTIVISRCNQIIEKKEWTEEEIADEVNAYISKGMTKKASIQQVSGERNISKNEVYEKYHHSLKRERN